MRVGLFIPCYVDAVFPNVAMASYKLLKSLGVDVTYPKGQTCCGQPMANAGFQNEALPLAEKMESMFSEFDYVVAPSVSCTAFLRVNYPGILKEGHKCTISAKAMDIIEFLHDILKVKSLPGKFPYRVSLHNSCHGVRELHLSSPSEIVEKPYNKIKDLLELIDGIEVVEPDRNDECCGFGGMFSIEETAVSGAMGRSKVERHIATGADYITGPDCSCLMHLSGVAGKGKYLSQNGEPIRFIHAVEILAAGL